MPHHLLGFVLLPTIPPHLFLPHRFYLHILYHLIPYSYQTYRLPITYTHVLPRFAAARCRTNVLRFYHLLFLPFAFARFAHLLFLLCCFEQTFLHALGHFAFFLPFLIFIFILRFVLCCVVYLHFIFIFIFVVFVALQFVVFALHCALGQNCHSLLLSSVGLILTPYIKFLSNNSNCSLLHL